METRSKNETLAVIETRNGLGVSARTLFAPDDFIFRIKGKYMSGDEDEVIEESIRDNLFRYDADRYISPHGTVGDYFNHSCNPNAKICKEGHTLVVRAIKTIPVGKEITFDYSTLVGRDDSWKMKCNCGSARCRKVVGRFAKLPQALQARYMRNGIVPTFIVEL